MEYSFCAMTVSDQLRGKVGEEARGVMKEMEWMRKEEMTEHYVDR